MVRATIRVGDEHIVDIVSDGRTRRREVPDKVGHALEGGLQVLEALDDGLDIVLVAKVGHGGHDGTEIGLDGHPAA